jgi:acid stress-induced BolA-like protein IbaG/YrbA
VSYHNQFATVDVRADDKHYQVTVAGNDFFEELRRQHPVALKNDAGIKADQRHTSPRPAASALPAFWLQHFR